MATVTTSASDFDGDKPERKKSQPARPRAFYVPLICEAGRLRAHGAELKDITKAIGISRGTYNRWRSKLKEAFQKGMAQGAEEVRQELASLPTAMEAAMPGNVPFDARKPRIQRGAEFWRSAILDAGRMDARGYNTEEIAAKFRASVSTYHFWRGRYRSDFDSARTAELAAMNKENDRQAAQTRAPVSGRRKSPAVVAEAARLRAAGMTHREIGERLGIAGKTISGWEKQADETWQASFIKERERQRQREMTECKIENSNDDFNRAIRIAAAFMVGGFSWEETAAALKMECEIVKGWQFAYATIWKKAFAAASLIANPRQMARKLLDEGAIDLPPTVATPGQSEDERLTLRQFYERHYVPRMKTRNCRPRTFTIYEHVLRRWEKLTDNPPLVDITDDIFAGFINTVAAQTSPQTANNFRRHLLSILQYAGPRGYRRAGARQILASVPFCEEVRGIKRLPKAWNFDELKQLLTACTQEPGKVGDVIASDWWTALVLFAVNTGLRKSAVLNLRRADVDLQKRTATVRGETQKHRADQVVVFSEAAAGWLQRIWYPERETLFDWPFDRNSPDSQTAFTRRFRKIHERAGLPTDHGLMQRLRRTAATLAEMVEKGAATILLDHSTPRLARAHYIDARMLPATRIGDGMKLPTIEPKPAV